MYLVSIRKMVYKFEMEEQYAYCFNSILRLSLIHIYDFAHLLFSDGDVTQSISLEKQLNIIQVADLVLPDKETSFEEYTTMELLSVAMLIVISTRCV